MAMFSFQKLLKSRLQFLKIFGCLVIMEKLSEFENFDFMIMSPYQLIFQ